MRRSTTSLLTGLAVLPLLILGGCKQHIGDSCGNSTDCSVTGERQCDLAQPGGYCTIFSCDPDTCPEGACVEWRFIPSRTAETWCMKTCDYSGDCNRGEYSCVFPDTITQSGDWDPNLDSDLRVARIIDLNTYKASAKICTALNPGQGPDFEQPALELDAGM